MGAATEIYGNCVKEARASLENENRTEGRCQIAFKKFVLNLNSFSY